MSSIQVYLDNYYDCCYPGQTITGRVECRLNQEEWFRAIRIKFKGWAKTSWSESERSPSSSEASESRSVTYYAEEEYFNAEYNLVQGVDKVYIPPGKHIYQFSYILPARLPCSFEGSCGYVRYYIKAIADRPWKFNYEHLFSLNVVSPLDLNYLPGVRSPVATSVDKTVCSCWCNDSGALTFEMSLPATGFVPGQEIHIGAHVENLTNVTVKRVEFEIIATLKFVTHYPSTKYRYDERLIAECRESGIGAHGDKSWTSSLIIPPQIPYSNLIPCSIINLTYRLKAKVVLPCPHTNLKNEVPVVIGTVPLAGISTTFSANPPTYPIPPTETSSLQSNVIHYPVEGPPSAPLTFNGFGEENPSAPPPYFLGLAEAPYISRGLSNPSALSAHAIAETPYSSNNSNVAPPSYEEANK